MSEVNERKIIEKVNKIVEDISIEIFSKSQENLITPDERGFITTDTGELLKSGNIKQEGENWIIEYSAPYSSYIEYGTEPHSIPVNPLIKWAKRKLRKNEKEAKKIAWAVRTKISKEGTEPKFFLDSAVREVLSKHRISYT